MSISIYDLKIEPENVGILWAKCQSLKDNIYNRWFDPFSEIWLLRVDMIIARKKFRGNVELIAEYLRPGREEWGGGDD